MHSLRIFQNSIYTTMLLWVIIMEASVSFALEIKANEVMMAIKNRGQITKDEINYTANFIMLNQAVSFDPNQGDVFLKCTVVWGKNDVYMKILYNYPQNPVYVSPSSGVYKQLDYDKNNRLILWRPIEKYILSTLGKTEILDKQQLIYVSPNGNFEASSDLYTIKHIFPANGTHDGTYEFKHFLLAAGLGFSDYIDPNNISESESLQNNDILIKTHGNFGKDVKGTWKLIVDPNVNFFVQKASFTNQKFSLPSVEVSMSNFIKKGELQYARQGELVFRGITKKYYEDIDISIKDNSILRQEVTRKITATLSPGSEIINFSSDKPIRTTVK